MRLAFAFVAPLVMATVLAGCGFKPMYAPETGAGAQIGPVVIGEVPTKMGHALRTELARMLDANQQGPTRRLEVEVTESLAGLGLRVDESASRSDLIATATYTLFGADGRPVVKNRVQAVVSYDLPGSAFGAASAQDDARERAGVMLAQRIRTDLALRLERARTAPASAVAVLPPEPAPEPEGLPNARTSSPVAIPNGQPIP